MDLFQTTGSSPPQFDFDLSGHGSLYLFTTLTPAAHAWVRSICRRRIEFPDGVVVVEHRLIGAIVEGAAQQGHGIAWDHDVEKCMFGERAR